MPAIKLEGGVVSGGTEAYRVQGCWEPQIWEMDIIYYGFHQEFHKLNVVSSSSVVMYHLG